MKRILTGVACVLILAIVGLTGWAWHDLHVMLTSTSSPRPDFDAEFEGVLDVCTEAHPYSQSAGSGAQRFYTLASGCRLREAVPFEPEAMRMYTVPRGTIESYFDRQENKVLNRLLCPRIVDEGEDLPREVTDDERHLLQLIAGLEHDLMDITIYRVGGEVFVCELLNVNWHSPYELRWYDRARDSLVLLYTFEDEKVTGLRIRVPERLCEIPE